MEVIKSNLKVNNLFLYEDLWNFIISFISNNSFSSLRNIKSIRITSKLFYKIVNKFIYFVIAIITRLYSTDLHDDALIAIIFMIQFMMKCGVEIFGKIVTDQYEKFQTAMIFRYVQKFQYLNVDT